MSIKKPLQYEVALEKVVHGGQALGTLVDGRKAFVWGALPEEEVVFRVTKGRKDYIEGIAEKVIKSSKHRVKNLDPEYLSTSPWQIFEYRYENDQKLNILKETFQRAKVEFESEINWLFSEKEFNYRNKMEYSFYGDDKGLNLALYARGSHRKQIIKGSSIAIPQINQSALKVVKVLEDENVRAGDLKSIVLRCDSSGSVVCALFVKSKSFPKIEKLGSVCKGLAVVFSNPKSPASVRTADLYSYGDISLKDVLLSTEINYDVFSFFQVNIDAFSIALGLIKGEIDKDEYIDLYSGVGSIGLAVGGAKYLIESDATSAGWAEINSKGSKTKVIREKSEKALQYIESSSVLVVDPPRAGLHGDLVKKIIETKPKKIIYLSCNPSTQARDLSMLKDEYKVKSVTGINFFPKTPHIECLVVLVRR